MKQKEILELIVGICVILVLLNLIQIVLSLNT